MQYSKEQLYMIMSAVKNVNRWAATLDPILGEKNVTIMEAMHDDYLYGLDLYEKEYYEKELPKVKQQIKEFREENKEFAEAIKQRKLHWLEELEKKAGAVAKKNKYKNDRDAVARWNNIKRQIERLKTSSITSDDIERAKEFPIQNMIKVNNAGFAKCINHNDSHPSMYCKNNFVHCFSCGYNGSVIDVYMKLNGCNFPTAVKAMS